MLGRFSVDKLGMGRHGDELQLVMEVLVVERNFLLVIDEEAGVWMDAFFNVFLVLFVLKLLLSDIPICLR